MTISVSGPQPCTADQLTKLAPYAGGSQPDARGEWEITCPMHKDTRRSASVNIRKGVWYCHAGCGGGSVRQLILNEDAWVPVEGRATTLVSVPSTAAPARVPGQPTMEQVQHWAKRLHREPAARNYLRRKRGLTNSTLRKAQVGWNGRHYTIPVFSPAGRLWNLRHYDPNPGPGRSKIWNTKGMGTARLYPIRTLNRLLVGDDVLYHEGEWDTLLALQHGHAAVTRTDGAGKPWHDNWTDHFAGLVVYLCTDRDRAGAQAAEVAYDALVDVADVRIITLPFRYRKTNGKDLTDYLLKYPLTRRAAAITHLKENAA